MLMYAVARKKATSHWLAAQAQSVCCWLPSLKAKGIKVIITELSKARKDKAREAGVADYTSTRLKSMSSKK